MRPLRWTASLLVALAAATPLLADEKQDAEAPLPAGAVMRLGETRFRPGVRERIAKGVSLEVNRRQ
jgi:hypothetical protein